jgi:hypothetical protein
MNTTLVPEYRAQIINDKCVVTVTGSHQDEVRNAVNKQFDGRARFEETNQTSTQVNDQTGPVGWIVAYEVPQAMSIRTVTDHRISLLGKKAA